MRKTECARDPENSLGFFVDLREDNGSDIRYETELILPYRTKLTIYLPPCSKTSRLSGISRVIREVEQGRKWPVRFEYENIRPFFSLEEMERLDSYLPNLTVYVYGVAYEWACDQEAYRCWRNSANRAAYVKLPQVSDAKEDTA